MKRFRFKHIMRERTEYSLTGSEMLLSVSEYHGVRPRTEIFADEPFTSRSASLEGYRRVYPGDFVMNYMLAWRGAYGVSEFEGIVSPAYAVFQIDTSKAYPRFLHYRLRSPDMHAYFRRYSKGIIESRLRLYPENFLALGVHLPDKSTQQRIADFLDRETARIDELISKKERLANLIDSKWRATVDHATIRGLGPPGMRGDTTSDGVDHVPSHWAVVALKRIAGIRYGISEPPEYRSDGVPLIRATNIRRGKIELNDVVFVNPNDIPPSRIVWLSPGDIIVVRSGAYTGDSALVRREHCPAIAGFDMVLTPKQCDPEFLQFVLLSSYVLDGQIGFYKMRAAQPHLNAAELGSLRIYLPPKEEQRHIVGYLNSQLARLERLREATLESIRKLRELRSALITCAVTGQIDIEEWRRRGEGERRMDMAEVELPEA